MSRNTGSAGRSNLSRMSDMASQSKRVLIVDDEESQREALAGLISAWGYAAISAEDGEEALEKLSEQSVHAIVTDLNMPRLDGFGLLKRLGEHGHAPPTIVLTAFGSVENAVTTVHELGAFWFLEKPIQPHSLRVLLARAVEQAALKQR